MKRLISVTICIVMGKRMRAIKQGPKGEIRMLEDKKGACLLKLSRLPRANRHKYGFTRARAASSMATEVRKR